MARTCVLAGALVAVLAGCGSTAQPKATETATTTSPVKRHVQPRIPVDATALYNSLAVVAGRRYSRLAHDDYKAKQGGSGSRCDDKGPSHFQCGVSIDLGFLGSSELWGYDVRVRPHSCWTATTLERYGAYQDDVESWQNREVLAPSTKDVKDDIRIARGMRKLEGCIRSGGGTLAGSDHDATFIAGLASQDIQRAYAGPQRKTRCRSLGKESVALAPDSWNFYCRTFLVSGKSYVDKIICFDPPPYKSYDSCTPEDGYPRRPPRRLP